MNSLSLDKVRQKLRLPAMLGVLAALSACALSGSTARSWIDDKTAVTVTAQKRVMVFFHDDFQVGVNVHDFADLGALEVNQAGKHRQYLCLVLWSTLARTPEQQAQLEDAFATFVVWADDQPLTFKRMTQNREMLYLSAPAFSFSSKANENYYEISVAQLTVLANAGELRITPATQAPGADPYRLWEKQHASLSAFVTEISGVNSLISPEAR